MIPLKVKNNIAECEDCYAVKLAALKNSRIKIFPWPLLLFAKQRSYRVFPAFSFIISYFNKFFYRFFFKLIQKLNFSERFPRLFMSEAFYDPVFHTDFFTAIFYILLILKKYDNII